MKDKRQTKVHTKSYSDQTKQKKLSHFSTRNYHLTASDFLKTIHTPAANIEQLNQDIENCFDEMKRQGYRNPILMGAIPFNIHNKSSLNFYAKYEKGANKKSVYETINNYNENEVVHKSLLIRRQEFESAVNLALTAFRTNKAQKIVLSQAVEYEFNQQQNPENLFNILLEQNPNAYNFLIALEQDQYILGASPELLLSRHERIVKSNPLAGSRPKSHMTEKDAQHRKELTHSEKDQNEHRIVVDNILKNLVNHCVELKISEYPDILETPTMLHLSSEFQGVVKKHAPNALNLALELHPTPAVCGSPTDFAKQFILDHEGYNRHYYTGLVGWMDANGNGEWVVTIRCGLLCENKIRIYAGAGIVEGSDAKTEWLETEAKMKTMLNVFNVGASI